MNQIKKRKNAAGARFPLWGFVFVAAIWGCDDSPEQDSPASTDTAVEDTSSGEHVDTEVEGTDTGGACQVGMTGCPCGPGGTCLHPADTCEDGVCAIDTAGQCDAGSLGCGCLAGECEAGLYCLDGACVDGAGYPGGACLPGGLCHPGNRCLGGVCVPCAPGSDGCACDAGECDYGHTCVDGLCRLDVPPETALCYTPCERGFLSEDGLEYRECPSDGLMVGCIDGKECTDGSCTAPGAVPPKCSADIDCPDFQTCIDGLCVSNCVNTTDCPGETECYRHVCRTPCRAEESICATNQYCHTVDGENGYCMPLAEPGSDHQKEVGGDFSLSGTILSFDKIETRATLFIVNHSPEKKTFSVRKLDDTVDFADGTSLYAEAPRDGTECVVAQGTCPLHWLEMGPEGDASLVQEFQIEIPAGGARTIEFSRAEASGGVRWRGRVEVANDVLGAQRVLMNYVESLDGRWNGKIFYFASFGTKNLEDWRDAIAGSADRTASDSLTVGNGLVQRWRSFRKGRLSRDEFDAVLTSTETGSWQWPVVEEDCEDMFGPGSACYPSRATVFGLSVYTSDAASEPIPSGMVELPIAMNLRFGEGEDPLVMTGRIDSSVAMQYPGNPKVSMGFLHDPLLCTGTPCLSPIDEFYSDIRIGGRYETTQSDVACAGHGGGLYEQIKVPWLVEGFERSTARDSETGLLYRYECRSREIPESVETSSDPEQARISNLNLSGSNPIPDGRQRKRELRLIDGALVDHQTVVILFEEKMSSFLDPDDEDGFRAYGYMVLKRENEDLEDEEFKGAVPPPVAGEQAGILEPVCSTDVLWEVLGKGDMDASEADAVVDAILVSDGSVYPSASELTADDIEQVHYLCADTGRFDSGHRDNEMECPPESNVVFFSLDSSAVSSDEIRSMSCQTAGTCRDKLNEWLLKGASGPILQEELVWRCENPNRVLCEDNRFDLREGKVFYADTMDAPVFIPLLTEIKNAFRYKTRFVSREGTGIGFAPEICIPNSDQVRYCYDPPKIEEARRRVDCLLHIWKHHFDRLDPVTAEDLEEYLIGNFSYHDESGGGIPAPEDLHDGFERLYSELLTMMGDESFTKAFASRYDLAGSRMMAFEGSLFEEGGIDLSGGAGYEMYLLYQAVQYYQEALDRFYAQSPLGWEALDGDNSTRNFYTPETVYWYFERLIQASTKKSRALREIAKRYQNFNRPDLARRVIRRAYTSSYLESVVLTRFILGIGDASRPENWAQLTKALEEAQLKYRMAMLDMYTDHSSITSSINYFGFTPDYIPFPPLDAVSANAFEVIHAQAIGKSNLARDRENQAISSNRSFETDSVAFQQELVRIRNTYENQLAAICGTFVGDDGRVYPAIEKYAYLSEPASLFGNPCGLMGSGELYSSMGQVDILSQSMQRIFVQYENVFKSVANEEARVRAQCELNQEIADYVYESQGKIGSLQTDVAEARSAISKAQRTLAAAQTIAELTKCSLIVGTASGGDCATSGLARGIFAAATYAVEMTVSGLEDRIIDKEAEIQELARAQGKWQTEKQCDVMKIDSEARVADMLLQLRELDLELLRTQYQIKLQLSEIQGLHNRASRIQLEQEETEQLAINIQAAQNDPNARIYRNDSIINAEIAFDDALRWAYRATRVYEYYTSRTYAQKDQLFLIRMVSKGEYNLDNYLVNLQNAFYDFEEAYGSSDTRVAILSLRDDVLRIPMIDDAGNSLDQAERIDLFREKISDASLLSEKGYLTLPFSTNFEKLSPLTRNHKILYVEAEIIGSDVGDTIGRLYLRQNGTGVVNTVSGDKAYYRFPTLTAVINPYFNGSRMFSAEVYRNYRLRQRPFVNTSWDVVINQRDESANKDINLQSLTDIRLFIYYTDFTSY